MSPSATLEREARGTVNPKSVFWVLAWGFREIEGRKHAWLSSLCQSVVLATSDTTVSQLWSPARWPSQLSQQGDIFQETSSTTSLAFLTMPSQHKVPKKIPIYLGPVTSIVCQSKEGTQHLHSCQDGYHSKKKKGTNNHATPGRAQSPL